MKVFELIELSLHNLSSVQWLITAYIIETADLGYNLIIWLVLKN